MIKENEHSLTSFLITSETTTLKNLLMAIATVHPIGVPINSRYLFKKDSKGVHDRLNIILLPKPILESLSIMHIL